MNASYAVITAPFDGRVTDVNAELQQFAATGTVLCKLDSIAKAEVETNLAPDLLAILPPRKAEKVTEQSRKDIRDLLTFTVETADQDDFRWPAYFLRFGEKVDPNTRMLPVVIGVDNPYGVGDDSPHLPLGRGLFCKVSIKGSERSEIVLPRYAVHEDSVYVVEDGKLVIRPVVVKYNLVPLFAKYHFLVSFFIFTLVTLGLIAYKITFLRHLHDAFFIDDLMEIKQKKERYPHSLLIPIDYDLYQDKTTQDTNKELKKFICYNNVLNYYKDLAACIFAIFVKKIPVE